MSHYTTHKTFILEDGHPIAEAESDGKAALIAECLNLSAFLVTAEPPPPRPPSPWDAIPRAAIEREALDYFRKHPDADMVWMEPAGEGRAIWCTEPSRNQHARRYVKTAGRLF